MAISRRFLNDGKCEISLTPDQKARLQSFQQLWKDDLVDQNCCLCGARDFESISEKDRYGLAIPTGACRRCGYMQSTKYYSSRAIQAFYSGPYRDVYGVSTPENHFKREYEFRAPNVYEFVHPLIPSGASVLDAGCNSGGVLKLFEERGYRTEGIDLDDRFIKYGKSKGLKLQTVRLEDFYPTNEYDLIIMCHSLEHFPDPLSSLRKVRSMLRPDGALYIEVPSIHNVRQINGGNLLKYFHIAHYSHYSTGTLTNIMGKAGFKSVIMTNFIRSLWRITEPSPRLHNPIDENLRELAEIERDFLLGLNG